MAPTNNCPNPNSSGADSTEPTNICTWFLNKVKPILLAYGWPRANDSARLLTKLSLPLAA